MRNSNWHRDEIILALNLYFDKDRGYIDARNPKIIQVSEICEFNFENKFGEVGKGFIECHLIAPLSKFDGSTETKLKDLALVCSNCHRMLHRYISVLNIEKFKLKVIKSN